MVSLPIHDSIKLQCFNAVLAEALGGQHVVEILIMFHVQHMTLEEIAKYHKLKTKRQALNVINRAHDTLKRCGLWIPEWQDKYRSRGQHKTVTVENLEAC